MNEVQEAPKPNLADQFREDLTKLVDQGYRTENGQTSVREGVRLGCDYYSLFTALLQNKELSNPPSGTVWEMMKDALTAGNNAVMEELGQATRKDPQEVRVFVSTFSTLDKIRKASPTTTIGEMRTAIDQVAQQKIAAQPRQRVI